MANTPGGRGHLPSGEARHPPSGEARHPPSGEARHPPSGEALYAARLTGNRSTMLVPTPSTDATDTSPPCASTTCLTMYRPRPVPPPPRSDLVPLCLYFSKIVWISSALIPIPLSEKYKQ